MAKMEPGALRGALANFTGTEKWTRHGLGWNVLMTDGVMFLQEHAEAYWLGDAIVSHIATNSRLKREHFQVWKFERHGPDRAAPNRPHLLTVTDGNSDKPIVTQEIEYTDFPLDEITIWACWDEIVDRRGAFVLLLPSEY